MVDNQVIIPKLVSDKSNHDLANKKTCNDESEEEQENRIYHNSSKTTINYGDNKKEHLLKSLKFALVGIVISGTRLNLL